jgi:hypothetical protein
MEDNERGQLFCCRLILVLSLSPATAIVKLKGTTDLSDHGWLVPSLLFFLPVLRIRIRRIRMFLDLLDPDLDPLVR